MELQNEPVTPSQNDATTTGEGAAEPTPGIAPSWRPADYYAAPRSKARFPRWVPISCGVAAVLALVLMTAVGIFFRNGGLASFVALAIGQFQGELKGMLAEDVSEDSRDQLDQSLRSIREGLTDGTIAQSAVLPLLQEIQKVSGDRKVTAEEIRALQAVIEKIGAPPGGTTEPVEL